MKLTHLPKVKNMKTAFDILSVLPQPEASYMPARKASAGDPSLVIDQQNTLIAEFQDQTTSTKEGSGSRVKTPKKSSVEILRKRTAEALAKTYEAGQQELAFGISQWSSGRRGVPNPLIRGGLFTTKSSPVRQTFKAEKIASLSTTNVTYSGEELRQTDLSAWMSIVNKGRDLPSGAPIQFTAYELIKDMKWRIHSDSYTMLKDCIERLKFTSVKISTKDEKGAYAGSLIRDYAFDAVSDEGKPKWQVRLEPAIVSLFINDQVTLLEWEQRRQIGTKASLTLWLHTFYSSHRNPIPFQVAKLHELCRSEDQRLSNFKVRLRRSLETLVDINFLSAYQIKNDVVYVTRVAYPSGASEVPLLAQ
jgi:hypothetical protein